jgi:hypothetical protein
MPYSVSMPMTLVMAIRPPIPERGLTDRTACEP